MAAVAAISHTAEKAYSLLNQMLLGRPGEYLTYKQVQQEGGYVRKGEKAHMMVFWKWLDKEDEETGQVTQRPLLKYYNVFILNSITIDCRKGEMDCMSQAFLQMAGVFSELELSMIRARVRSGIENAKAKGRRIGRRPTTKDDIPAAFYKHYPAYVSGDLNVSEFVRACGLSRQTVYKYIKLL